MRNEKVAKERAFLPPRSFVAVKNTCGCTFYMRYSVVCWIECILGITDLKANVTYTLQNTNKRVEMEYNVQNINFFAHTTLYGIQAM